MKKIIAILIVLLVTGFTFAAPPINIGPNVEGLDAGIFQAKFNAAPKAVDVNGIAQKLVGNEQFSTFGNVRSYNVSNTVLRIDSIKGDVVFRKPFNLDAAVIAILPSKEEAPAIALQHLADLDMMPASEELVLQDVGGLTVATYDASTGETIELEKIRTVYFRREIAGIPVHGASRVVVKLGENGELLGVIKRWTEVSMETLHPSQLKSNNQFRSLVNQGALKRNAAASRVDIKEAKLVLWDDGTFIEPALLVQGDAFDNDVKYVTDFVIPLLKNPQATYPGEAELTGDMPQE